MITKYKHISYASRGIILHKLYILNTLIYGILPYIRVFMNKRQHFPFKLQETSLSLQPLCTYPVYRLWRVRTRHPFPKKLLPTTFWCHPHTYSWSYWVSAGCLVMACTATTSAPASWRLPWLLQEERVTLRYYTISKQNRIIFILDNIVFS